MTDEVCCCAEAHSVLSPCYPFLSIWLMAYLKCQKKSVLLPQHRALWLGEVISDCRNGETSERAALPHLLFMPMWFLTQISGRHWGLPICPHLPYCIIYRAPHLLSECRALLYLLPLGLPWAEWLREGIFFLRTGNNFLVSLSSFMQTAWEVSAALVQTPWDETWKDEELTYLLTRMALSFLAIYNPGDNAVLLGGFILPHPWSRLIYWERNKSDSHSESVAPLKISFLTVSNWKAAPFPPICIDNNLSHEHFQMQQTTWKTFLLTII